MKNMKINFFLILAGGFLFYSCETENVTVNETNSVINGHHLEIYTIDSCEYVGYVHGSNSDMLTHKGNCSYCLKRQNYENIHRNM